jgi:hypothetical protein
MNCYQHSEVPAVAFCRTCGRSLCAECKRVANGTVYCQEHVPAVAPPAVSGAYYSAAPSAPAADASPGLAFTLGLIPGVGAIYNGQYGKGLVHAVVTGLLISIMETGAAEDAGALFGFVLVAWWLYMAMEAYHTARKRRAGEVVDEFSSLINLRAGGSGFPTGAVLLITIGVVMLLNTLEILRFRHLIRFWPLILIATGGYMLYMRMAGAHSTTPTSSSNTALNTGVAPGEEPR